MFCPRLAVVARCLPRRTLPGHAACLGAVVCRVAAAVWRSRTASMRMEVLVALCAHRRQPRCWRQGIRTALQREACAPATHTAPWAGAEAEESAPAPDKARTTGQTDARRLAASEHPAALQVDVLDGVVHVLRRDATQSSKLPHSLRVDTAALGCTANRAWRRPAGPPGGPSAGRVAWEQGARECQPGLRLLAAARLIRSFCARHPFYAAVTDLSAVPFCQDVA
jgi:hypothetical protein